MDTRKMTLIATIVVIALLAVGIGYAYTAYSQNGGNNTKTTYITLTQEGTTGYTFATNVTVEMETYNEINTNTTYYKLSDSTDLTASNMGKYTLMTLGEIELHASIENFTPTQQQANPPNLDVNITGSKNFAGTANWYYFLGSAVDNGAIEVYAYKNSGSATSSWIDGPDALSINWNAQAQTPAYEVKTVYVYYGYNYTNTVLKDGIRFMAVVDIPENLVNASLTFVASSTAMDSINYRCTNASSTVTEFTSMVTKTTSRVYSLATPTSIGFEAPDGQEFKGWGLTPNATEFVTSATVTQGTSVTVYAIYGEPANNP